MIFGLARDYKAGENRTIATPREIASIVNAGFTAIVQKGAGERAGFPDARYEQAGARMVDSLAEVYAGADFVVKVKEIPKECTAHTRECYPGSVESLRKALEQNEKDGGTAAVLLEPFGPESGTRVAHFDYCRKARELCDEFGALLIFDEVVTAFRVGPGGAQGYFNVRPDLTVFGKIVAGGFPMAGGLGGRADVMSCIAAGVKAGKKRAYVGGTLSANPLSCAAGYYAIKEIVGQDAARKAGENGDKLCAGIKKLIGKYGLPFVAWNMGSIVHFEVSGVMYLSAADSDIFKKIPERQHNIEEFGAALTANGLVTLAGSRIYTSMADDESTIDETLAAFDDVFANIEI